MGLNIEVEVTGRAEPGHAPAKGALAKGTPLGARSVHASPSVTPGKLRKGSGPGTHLPKVDEPRGCLLLLQLIAPVLVQQGGGL